MIGIFLNKVINNDSSSKYYLTKTLNTFKLIPYSKKIF